MDYEKDTFEDYKEGIDDFLGALVVWEEYTPKRVVRKKIDWEELF